MATAAQWLSATRPRTLSAAIAPVLSGTAIAAFAPGKGLDGSWERPGGLTIVIAIKALACLLVALGLQIGSNFANDYADGVRGTDDHRIGPTRLVASGQASPLLVKRAAWLSMGLAVVIGLALLIPLAWSYWLAGQGLWVTIACLLVGLACVWAAWSYTAGHHPYGYIGLGELFVFVFFGLVATIGTVVVLRPPGLPVESSAGLNPPIPWAATWVLAIVMGLLACAILVANNLRDIAEDRASGKLTLPARLGDHPSRVLYVGLIGLAQLLIVLLAMMISYWLLLGLLGLLLAAPACHRVWSGASGRSLIAVLAASGRAQLLAAIGLLAGLILNWWL
ncbi:MAG: 1,4-dihydroxy-2-naphthoate polyprenyltransferase [Propionibacteriaceae bacterium]|nr:1,4-dihydroxy-2-naphthoate polyprenyltransferase [Propionibacteriaceae bacterium]